MAVMKRTRLCRQAGERLLSRKPRRRDLQRQHGRQDVSESEWDASEQGCIYQCQWRNKIQLGVDAATSENCVMEVTKKSIGLLPDLLVQIPLVEQVARSGGDGPYDSKAAAKPSFCLRRVASFPGAQCRAVKDPSPWRPSE